MDKRLSVLVCSCDAYEDLWDPFFECISKFSPNGVPYSVYLNTEKKKFTSNSNLGFEVITLNQKEEKPISWSKRMIEALNAIEEEYVFLLLDDFFTCDNIRYDCFETIMDIMDSDLSIASFQLYGTRIRNANPAIYDNGSELKYDLIHENGWKTHFVPTIWRKSVLLKWLRPWETIWAFERCASSRAKRWKYPIKYIECIRLQFLIICGKKDVIA